MEYSTKWKVLMPGSKHELWRELARCEREPGLRAGRGLSHLWCYGKTLQCYVLPLCNIFSALCTVHIGLSDVCVMLGAMCINCHCAPCLSHLCHVVHCIMFAVYVALCCVHYNLYILHCALCCISDMHSAQCTMPPPPVLRPALRKIRRSFVRLPIQLHVPSDLCLFVCLPAMTKCPNPPRLVELTKWANFPGYGFNLHAEKARQGEKTFLQDFPVHIPPGCQWSKWKQKRW